MPRGLPYNVKKCLEKAIDSSLLAVETYNKPATSFKSGGYIVLMCIAWTALFHAVFFKRKIKPFYRKADGLRFLIVDGDYKYWELNTCLEKYYITNTNDPIRKNLEFFIRLRNKIEHKSLPEIDSNIFGECQAMLFNFDNFIEREFGEKYCIREALTFSLQLFPSRKTLSGSIKPSSVTTQILHFINQYRSSISTEIIESGHYSFKAFLIQISNHANQEALPVQFVQWDKLSEEEKNAAKRVAALVQQKQTEVPVINANLLKPKEVVKQVQERLGNRQVQKAGKNIDYFNMHTHSKAWKRYNIRPSNNSKSPSKTNKEYCIYDKAHNDYLYKPEWVSFLADKLGNDEEYRSLFNNESTLL
jgi:hypothetical protein